MKNDDSPKMMISEENGDLIRSPSPLKLNGISEANVEETPIKKTVCDQTVNNGISDIENKDDTLSDISTQPPNEIPQQSPYLNEFLDPVLFERLKGTIKLRLQTSISQSMKKLLNATQSALEEGRRLRTVNNDLHRRIKKVQDITQKVQESVAERIPTVVQEQGYHVDPSSNGVDSSAQFGQVSQTSMETIVETAPLPEIDSTSIHSESALPPVQPPLRIAFRVSSEEGTQLAFELDQVDHTFEPAEVYELYSYASSDVNPQTGLTSSLWQPVGSIEALPLPLMLKLDYLQSGNIYHFAALSVDKYKRKSNWSNVASLPVGLPETLISSQIPP